MKVHETAKPFKPIHLILENQEEIDAISTIVNSIQITKTFPALDSWLEQLAKYGDCETDMDKLRKILRK